MLWTMLVVIVGLSFLAMASSYALRRLEPPPEAEAVRKEAR
jgi:hypothetical protein